MNKLSIKILICSITSVTLGFLSGLSSVDAIKSWYLYINKPSWNPPDWLFAPVWACLYVLLGIAIALVWHSKQEEKRKSILLFIFQFALNLAWPALFFGQHQMGLAFVEILVMLFVIILTTISFFKVNNDAGLLMIPYILWVSFACFLNGAIWLLNK